MSACTSKNEDKIKEQESLTEKVETKVDTLTEANNQSAESSKIISILGTYSGTFDQRNAVLNIKSQKGNEFEGNITINYRQVINQKVKGSFNEGDKSFKMSDQLHSRFAGSYYGNFSNDFTSMSGTFIQNVDKTKFTFNLKK